MEPTHMHEQTNLSRILILQVALFLALLGTSTAALAQQSGTDFQLQRFRPLGDPKGMFQTQSGEAMGHFNYMVGAYINYAKDPLILRKDDNSRYASLISHQLGFDIFAGIGFSKWFDVKLTIPFTMYQAGSIPNIPTFRPEARDRSLTGFSFSDIKLSGKAQLLFQKKHSLNLALQLELGLPTGNQETMNGEDGPSVGAAVLLSHQFPVVDIAINLGYRYLPSTTFLNLIIQHELFYSLGSNVHLIKNKFDLLFEVNGFTSVNEELSLDSVPFDLYLGARFYPLKNTDLAINVGVGIGISRGYGSPQFRTLAGVTWAPRDDDYDKDGILNNEDRCPRVPGPRDNQGCPWSDTDKDGLTDNVDRCPIDPGPKENQGCPWPDTDKDGLIDKEDVCPLKPGPKKNKGCPWGDRDLDGIVDPKDKCPDIPGIPEKQGCPSVVLVEVTKKEIKILQKIFFAFNSDRLLPKSFPVLDQVFSVLKSRPTLHIEIQGHTDNVGGKQYNMFLSQRRAESVRLYLYKKGITGQRLMARGYGLTVPIDSNNTPEGRSKNRRVQFKITAQ